MADDSSRHEPFDTSAFVSRRTLVWVAVLGFVPTAALLMLHAFDVPIGQPFFLIYRYSPFPLLRAATVLVAMLIGGVGLWTIYRLSNGGSETISRWCAPVGLIFFAALVAWTFVAPPRYVEQHIFNMQSPSHEGAFVLEARVVESIREYVQTTFYERIQNTPEQMLGRRVLSNPPGMTILFVVCKRTVEHSDSLGRLLIRLFNLDQVDDPAQRVEFAAAMLYAMILTAAWGLSIIPAYALGRLAFPPLPAMCLAFACVFNPATVSFTPGKDPTQLFTVLTCIYFWMRAFLGKHYVWGALSGAVFLIGLGVGLIHVWAMAIVVSATGSCVIKNRSGVRLWLTGCCLPFLAGVFAASVCCYALFGWNVIMTAYVVAIRYREMQVPIITDPFYWTLVGLPMFLLFVGPYFWAMFAVRQWSSDCELVAAGRQVPRRSALASVPNARGSAGASPSHMSNARAMANARPNGFAARQLGTYLLAACAVVLMFTYFYGNNNETPRLWIPFIPLLFFGMTLRRGILCSDTPTSRRLCLFLIALQLVGTLAHWSMMDVRESEYRLSTGRMWD